MSQIWTLDTRTRDGLSQENTCIKNILVFERTIAVKIGIAKGMFVAFQMDSFEFVFQISPNTNIPLCQTFEYNKNNETSEQIKTLLLFVGLISVF